MADFAVRAIGAGLRNAIGPAVTLVAATLMLAGAIHIGAILLVPAVARTDGWSRLDRFAGIDAFSEVPASGMNSEGVFGLDPLFVTGACRLQLEEAPAGLAVEPLARFWSLALYDPNGTIIFSLNDRTAVDGRLDMRVLTRADSRQAGAPDLIEQTIDVESDSADLIALLRLFAPTRSMQAEARAELAAARCFAAPGEVE